MIKKTLLHSLALAVIAACAISAEAAGINKGFFKKAAESAWKLDSEGLFDAQKPIPDSIAAGQSAVVIARHDDFVGDRIEQNTIYTQTGRTNRTALTHITRSMVKLLDQSAVEAFGDFEFGSTHEKHAYGIKPMRHADRAFGARIHKPDGTIKDVDVSQALEVSDGKAGGKNKKFKLAIPGLEVGDVIEYFYYTKYENEDGDIELVDVMLTDRYPVMSRLLTGKFDPTLTIEIKSYNGAPLVSREKIKDKNSVRLYCDDLPAVGFRKFLFEERQLPFIRVNTINHHDVAGEFTRRANHARGAGIFQNIAGDRIQTETMENVVSLAMGLYKMTKPISRTPARALSTVKAYAKAHPEATPRDLADAAWLAVSYHNATTKDDDDTRSTLLLSMFHNEVIEKLDIYPREQTGIAFANGRDEVPIDEISKWNQTTFMSLVDGVTYDFTAALHYAPGEVPATFQDAPAISITGRLRDHTYADGFKNFKLNDRKYVGNKAIFNTTVSVNPDNPEILDISRQATLSGSAKAMASDFIDAMDWVRAVEDFFDIPESKRFKSKTYSAEDRQLELNQAIREECAENLGIPVDTVTNFTLTDIGAIPGKTSMTYSMDCQASDLVEDLGDGLSIRLGKLIGNQPRLDEHERDRMLDALLWSASTDTYMITLKVPQGYKVDETSLADLNRNVANNIGQFIVQASINADGNVEVQCMERVRVHSVPLQSWPMLLELCDAASAFTDASLVLTRQ